MKPREVPRRTVPGVQRRGRNSPTRAGQVPVAGGTPSSAPGHHSPGSDGGERRRRGGILWLRLPRPTEPHRLCPVVLPSPTAAVTGGRNGTGGKYNNNRICPDKLQLTLGQDERVMQQAFPCLQPYAWWPYPEMLLQVIAVESRAR